MPSLDRVGMRSSIQERPYWQETGTDSALQTCINSLLRMQAAGEWRRAVESGVKSNFPTVEYHYGTSHR